MWKNINNEIIKNKHESDTISLVGWSHLNYKYHCKAFMDIPLQSNRTEIVIVRDLVDVLMFEYLTQQLAISIVLYL